MKRCLLPRVCLGRCLAPSIAGIPFCLGSYLAFLLDSFWASSPWHFLSGILDFCHFIPILLIHLFRLALPGSALHPAIAPQLALRAICMDRTPTPGDIVRLTQGIADLTQAVQELSVRVTNLRTIARTDGRNGRCSWHLRRLGNRTGHCIGQE